MTKEQRNASVQFCDISVFCISSCKTGVLPRLLIFILHLFCTNTRFQVSSSLASEQEICDHLFSPLTKQSVSTALWQCHDCHTQCVHSPSTRQHSASIQGPQRSQRKILKAVLQTEDLMKWSSLKSSILCPLSTHCVAAAPVLSNSPVATQ